MAARKKRGYVTLSTDREYEVSSRSCLLYLWVRVETERTTKNLIQGERSLMIYRRESAS